jgi:tetratricopeptide (TPR) repeat protein
LPATEAGTAPVAGWLIRLGRQPRWLGAALFLIVLAVYLPAVRHEFIDYDDNGYVYENDWVRHGLTWSNIGRAFRTADLAYWHPLTWISHLCDVELYGLNPGGHHLTSVLIHALNTLLVFVVFRRMTGATWRSWLVAALFGLHPFHIESVAWVAERKDVLSTLWWLAALWCYARWAEETKAGRPRAWRFYGLSLAAFAAGLMSKPMVVTFPCVLLLFDYWPFDRLRRGVVWLLLEKVPFFALSIISAILTVRAQADLATVAPLTEYPWTGRLANAVYSYALYVGKCFWPTDLAVFYPYLNHLPAGAVAVSVMVLVGISAAAVITWKKAPYLLTGWLFFLGTLVPVIGFVQVGAQAMADRYSYVPLLGIFVAFIWGAGEVGRRISPAIMASVAAMTLALLTFATARQLRFWQNSEALFRHALDVTANNWVAHECLGYYYAQRPADLDQAIAEYLAMVQLVPGYAPAHFSLAAVLARRPEGQAEAAAEYAKALSINPRLPSAAAALGRILRTVPGRQTEAAAALTAAVQLAPTDSDLREDLADLLAAMPDRQTDAAEAYRAVLQLRPDWVEVHSNLGLVLSQLPGHLPEAVAEYETVVRAKPEYAGAHNNLANALGQLPGRSADALTEYETALRLEPQNYEFRFNYALLLARLPNRQPDAIAQFEAVLRLKPDLEQAREQLARLRALR